MEGSSLAIGSPGEICFWTKAEPKEIHAIVKQMGADFPYRVTSDMPGGDLTIVMGKDFVTTMQQRGCLPKNRTVTSARGQVYDSSFGKFMVSFDPGMRHIESDALAQITWDIRLARRFMKNGNLAPKLGVYRWTDDFSELIEKIETQFEATGEPVDVAVDTETMDLWPWYPDKHIVTIQASCEPGTADVVYTLGMEGAAFRQFKEQVKWLLNTEKVKLKGANWKYDAVWIWVKWQIECSNFTMDTTAVGSLLDEDRSNSLKWHVKQHVDDLGGYDDTMKSDHDMGHMELIPKDDLLPYTGGDADGTLRVANVFRTELARERRLQHFYVKLLHPALKAYEKVERRGMLIDLPKYKALGVELRNVISGYETQLVGMLSPRLKARHAEQIRDKLTEGKSPLTAKILKEHFFDKQYGMGLTPRLRTGKTQEPSTAHEHLVMFNDEPNAAEFVKLFQKMGVARKTLTTYVGEPDPSNPDRFMTGFLSHLRPDGRLHPTYMLFNGEMFDDASDDGGTVTGRLSCKNPAMQTLPKHTDWGKRIRECYIAPPGQLMWQFDFSQGELRIAACDANETRMIKAYLDGADVHGITGATFAEMNVAEFLSFKQAEEGSDAAETYDKYRQRGKHANFGMIFEISAPGFQEYCRRKELHITLKESEDYLSKFFQTWPRLRPWQEESKQFARQHKFVMSPLGRIRHLPLINSRDSFTRSRAERQAINSKIQSTLSDLCIWGVSIIEEKLGDAASVIGTTHDSCYGYVDEDKADVIMPQIREILLSLPYEREFDWKPQLTFPVDGELGPNMAKLKKLKFAD